MNTDTDALAAYFEAWREGWPVPGGWEYSVYYDSRNFEGNSSSMPEWFRREDASTVIMSDCPEDLDIQALTGVLVVELARRTACQSNPRHYMALHAAIMSGLPGVVRLWLEVNK